MSNTSNSVVELSISGLLKKVCCWQNVKDKGERRMEPEKSYRETESLIRENLGGRCCVDITGSLTSAIPLISSLIGHRIVCPQ